MSRGDTRAAPARSDAWEVVPEAVLFEDRHVLALAKPPGLASQARRDDRFDHLLAAGERYLRRRTNAGRGAKGRLFLVHRLDRGTSGIVLLAKHKTAARNLGRAFSEGRIEKLYLAICIAQHEPPVAVGRSWTVRDRLALERLPNGRRRALRVDDGGRPAETGLRILERHEHPRWGETMLAEARPATGRTHQIRVHLALEGLPIVGDRLYAPRSIRRATRRPMLHARRLRLAHPITAEPLELDCPLPSDFRDALAGLADHETAQTGL